MKKHIQNETVELLLVVHALASCLVLGVYDDDLEALKEAMAHPVASKSTRKRAMDFVQAADQKLGGTEDEPGIGEDGGTEAVALVAMGDALGELLRPQHLPPAHRLRVEAMLVCVACLAAVHHGIFDHDALATLGEPVVRGALRTLYPEEGSPSSSQDEDGSPLESWPLFDAWLSRMEMGPDLRATMKQAIEAHRAEEDDDPQATLLGCILSLAREVEKGYGR